MQVIRTSIKLKNPDETFSNGLVDFVEARNVF